MDTKANDILLSISGLTSIELISVFTNAGNVISTACQVAIAAATVYKLIKDKDK